MTGSARRIIRLITKLCGESALPNLVLATTHWSANSEERARQEARETQLREQFWYGLLERGAESMAVDANSAADIVRAIVETRDVQTPATCQRKYLWQGSRWLPSSDAQTNCSCSRARILDFVHDISAATERQDRWRQG